MYTIFFVCQLFSFICDKYVSFVKLFTYIYEQISQMHTNAHIRINMCEYCELSPEPRPELSLVLHKIYNIDAVVVLITCSLACSFYYEHNWKHL